MAVLGPKGHPEYQVPRASLAQQGSRVPPDRSDPRDPMDQRVLLGFVDQKVLRGSQGWQTCDPAQMVQQAPWVPRGNKVL